MEIFEDLKGKILIAIENNRNSELIFTLKNRSRYKLYHDQDCCEEVRIEDINGELEDLIGSTLLMAEKVSTVDISPEGVPIYDNQHFTWTFYKLATTKGYVTVRWYGSSNGYYSEDVHFAKA